MPGSGKLPFAVSSARVFAQDLREGCCFRFGEEVPLGEGVHLELFMSPRFTDWASALFERKQLGVEGVQSRSQKATAIRHACRLVDGRAPSPRELQGVGIGPEVHEKQPRFFPYHRAMQSGYL